MERRLVYICEICGAVLDEHHCKAQCPNCGRMFDCSDLPIMRANGTIDEDGGEFVVTPGGEPLELAGADQNGAAAAEAADPHAEEAPPTALTVRPSMERKGPLATPQKPDRKGNVADMP